MDLGQTVQKADPSQNSETRETVSEKAALGEEKEPSLAQMEHFVPFSTLSAVLNLNLEQSVPPSGGWGEKPRTQIPEFKRNRKDSSGTDQNQGEGFGLMWELG
jgi:hypothetical protein